MLKRITTLIVAFAISLTISFGQITTSKFVVPKTEPVYYDSTQNFVGKDVTKYIGQELYLLELSEGSLRETGYWGLIKDYRKSSRSYLKSLCACYEEFAGKYFKVIDVIENTEFDEFERRSGKLSFLKLEEKDSKAIIYYEYRDSQPESDFPFVVVGYFTKLKQTRIGKKFVIRGRNWVSSEGKMTEMNTGLPVSSFEVGSIWKCVDVTVELRFYELSLVLQNDKGEQIPISIRQSEKTNYYVFEFTQAEKLKERFGIENWQQIIRGNIKVGMTKEMCLQAWGNPGRISETTYAGKKSEHLHYLDRNVFLTNGIVTAIQ